MATNTAKDIGVIKEDEFRRQIKKGLSGAYVFFGNEDYMKSFALKSAKESVCPDETFAAFNEMRFDALSYTPEALADAIMPLPMMCDQKFISITGLDMNGMKAKEVDALCETLGMLSEYDYNVVIISVPAGLLDEGNIQRKKPSALLSKLSECATPVYFEPIVGSRLVAWVGKHLEYNGVHATPELCARIIERCGSSMYVLSFETEKLAYYVLWNGRDTVSEGDIENVCVADISTEAYALSNAILDGRNDEALKAIEYLKFQRVDPIPLMGEVSGIICSLVTVRSLIDKGVPTAEIARLSKLRNEYLTRRYIKSATARTPAKLKRALALCSEADMLLKGSQSMSGYAPIEKLICSL